MRNDPAILRRSATVTDKLFRWAYRLVYPFWRCFLRVSKRTPRGTQVAVWSGDCLLVIKNSYRKEFTLPGGYIATGEEPVAGAQRELQEETGLRVATDQLVYRCLWSSAQGRSVGQCFLFECWLEQWPEVTIDNREVIEAQFVTLQQAAALPLASHVKQYLSTSDRGCTHLAD